MLEDESIQAVAIQGRVEEIFFLLNNLWNLIKHIWLNKPSVDDLERFCKILDLVNTKHLLVQRGYMLHYNTGFDFLIKAANSGKLEYIFSVRARISSDNLN